MRVRRLDALLPLQRLEHVAAGDRVERGSLRNLRHTVRATRHRGRRIEDRDGGQATTQRDLRMSRRRAGGNSHSSATGLVNEGSSTGKIAGLVQAFGSEQIQLGE